MVRYWLVKTEPETFSFSDLQTRDVEPWNGVRNYQARNYLKQMQQDDLVLVYHSATQPSGVAGLARVARAAYPDNLQFDPDSPYFDAKSTVLNPRWYMVDVAAIQPLNFIPLVLLKTLPELVGSPLVQKGNRLSVLPVQPREFDTIMRLGEQHDIPLK